MKPALYLLPAALLLTPALSAANLQSAKVTKVVNDVKIFKQSAAAKKATIGDVVSGKTSLQTGRRSRSELIFQDKTLTRVGANSIFSFDQGTRDLKLEQGTILLQVPKNAGGARIRTATVTAAITGTTIMMEYRAKMVKIIVLEGTLKAWIERDGVRRPQILKAGDMVFLKANAKTMPKPVEVDLKKIMQTSGLASAATFGPLPGSALEKINTSIARQDNLKSEGILAPQNPGGPQGPAGGPASSPAARTSETRDTINDSVEPPPPREGDDPRR